MHFLYTTVVCLCLLVFNLQSTQVAALLNITEDALVTSRKLLKEIEDNSFITTEDELHKKLNIIKEIAYNFERKYEFEMRDKYDWLDSINQRGHEIKNASLSFMHILKKFKQLKKKIYVTKGIVKKYINVSSNETTFIISRPIEIFNQEFPEFAKNKYNLNIKGTIGLFRDNYRYMQDVFTDLYQLFFYIDEESHMSIFEFLKNTTKYVPTLSLGKELGTKSSPQLRLFYTIRNLIVDEAFYCVRYQYYMALVKAYSDASAFLKNDDRRALDLMKQHWGELDALNLMKMYEEKFEFRSTEVFNKVKPALSSLSRRFSQPALLGRSDHTKLKAFEKYVINEVDLNEDGSCKKTCSDYKQVERVFGCFDGGICSVHRQCKGKLWDCEDIVEPAYICSWDKKNKYQGRYKFIKGNDYRPEEENDSCPTPIKNAESWRRGFYKCNYCQCKCEDAETYSNRYFSLRPATSNIYDNYVVVGVRFITIKHVVHLQVGEGKLLPNGQLDSVAFAPIKEFDVTDYDIVAGKDFQAVTGLARTVCFDELVSPNDHLLTGLRLKFQNGYFMLEIRMTQFDYATGRLYPEKSVWYSKDTDFNQRPKINLQDFHYNSKDSVKIEGCVQFTTNEMKDIHDLGQNTVPYIDTRALFSDRYVPLSGAGIILKKGYTDAFLGFQLINQNVAVHMK